MRNIQVDKFPTKSQADFSRNYKHAQDCKRFFYKNINDIGIDHGEVYERLIDAYLDPQAIKILKESL